jgi:aminoglycoside 6'-N-acetyltransferase
MGAVTIASTSPSSPPATTTGTYRSRRADDRGDDVAVTDAAHESSVRFRPLEEGDLPTVSSWLANEHVRAWWKDPADIDAVRAKYLPRIRGDEPTEVFVASMTATGPFGLIQRYRFSDHGTWAATVAGTALSFPDAAGIDYLIGSSELTGRGLGTDMIRAFSRQLFADLPDIATIVVTPQHANRRSCRALEKAGYRLEWVGRLDSDDPADAGDAAVYVQHWAIASRRP